MEQQFPIREVYYVEESLDQKIARLDKEHGIGHDDTPEMSRAFYVTLPNGDIERMLEVGRGEEYTKLYRPGLEGLPVMYVSHDTLLREHQEELRVSYERQRSMEAIMGGTAIERAAVKPKGLPRVRIVHAPPQNRL